LHGVPLKVSGESDKRNQPKNGFDEANFFHIFPNIWNISYLYQKLGKNEEKQSSKDKKLVHSHLVLGTNFQNPDSEYPVPSLYFLNRQEKQISN